MYLIYSKESVSFMSKSIMMDRGEGLIVLSNIMDIREVGKGSVAGSEKLTS